MIKTCTQCTGQVEQVTRMQGGIKFFFCRACKIPYDESGSVIIDLNSLQSAFNPLTTARDTIGVAAKGATPVAQTAMAALAVQGYLDAYFSGMKDGIALAYSQDYKRSTPLGSSHEPVRNAASRARQDQG